MTMRIPLYTSLPPRSTRRIANVELGHSYLMECVRSWKRAGFDVVSLNSAREIDELTDIGYDIEFREVGDERPRIRDFLEAIRESEDPVAGIINADIFLADNPDLLTSVLHHTASGMVFFERINIDPFSLRPTGRSCNGFDTFIFATAPLLRIDLDCDLLFGEPWWDYWFPLAYASVGGRLMATGAPLTFHLDHVQNWRQAQWTTNGRKTVRYLLQSTGVLSQEFVARIRPFAGATDISDATLGPFAHWCFAWLRETAETIKLMPRPSNDSPLPSLVASLNSPDVRDLVGELNEAQAAIIDLKEREGTAKATTREITNETTTETTSGPTRETAREQPRDESHSSEALRNLVARLYGELERISLTLSGTKIRSDDEALRTVTDGARILTSRRANLRHFLALNAAWIDRKYHAVSAALKGRMGSGRQAAEADQWELKLAKEEGKRYLASVEHGVKAADAGAMKPVGDYIVAFLQGKADGLGERAGAVPDQTPDGRNCHIQIAVLDAIDMRFVPELKIKVMLLDAGGRKVASFRTPFVWHPGFHHYAASIKLAKGGRHDLLVTIDSPSFRR